ncbi:hypothetical protein [Variovorax sp. EL159]|uniref:hypothetical protein n=1 Tax=Variovorax sp. EL159 TaxID=1566270 RepID=UPI00115FDBD9|nr:hypothetical protein [Variovorax sp. EL159]
MQIEASIKTAAVAGAWASFGLVPFEGWMAQHPIDSALAHNLLWLSAALMFFILPAYFFVFGRGSEPFGRTWFIDPAERARYAVIAKRMFAWFISAGIVGSLWSWALSLVIK